MMRHEPPGALIARFVLSPNDILGRRIFPEYRAQFLVGDRIKLLDTDQSDSIQGMLGARADEIEINPATAEYQSGNGFGVIPDCVLDYG